MIFPLVTKMAVDYHRSQIGVDLIDKRLIFSTLSGNHGWIINFCAFYMKIQHLLLFPTMTSNHFEISDFLEKNQRQVSWDIREDQPLHLSILQQLSIFMKDADETLFQALQNGVSTGRDGDIAPSSCFPVAASTLEDPSPLSIHVTNWQSAENDLTTTRQLVQQEIDKGWVYKYPGTLADAQTEFGEKLAVGRLGLALSESRPPRLVVDSSICGLNSQITIPETTTLPSALDVLRVYPLRNIDDSLILSWVFL